MGIMGNNIVETWENDSRYGEMTVEYDGGGMVRWFGFTWLSGDAGIGGTPWPRGSARRGRWVAGWPSGLRNTAWIIASLTALPDQTTDYDSAAFNWLRRRSVWLPFRRVAQSRYRWLTTLQSTLAPTPDY